jgi:transcriptional regulator of arginine metabolism
MRSERRRDLLRLLREGQPTSQQDIVVALQRVGHEVTQATVSRDLREIGALKVRVNGGFVYRMADDVPRSPAGDLGAASLERTLAAFVIDVRPAGSLIVVNTAPGHAAAVGRAIDYAAPAGVVGTVAGDDTIFVATPDSVTAQHIADGWLAQVELTGGMMK